jgi:hypothetical protein
MLSKKWTKQNLYNREFQKESPVCRGFFFIFEKGGLEPVTP